MTLPPPRVAKANCHQALLTAPLFKIIISAKQKNLERKIQNKNDKKRENVYGNVEYVRVNVGNRICDFEKKSYQKGLLVLGY